MSDYDDSERESDGVIHWIIPDIPFLACITW